MAITAITGLADKKYVAAFNDVPVEVATNNASATMIQCYIEYATSKTIAEYAQVIDGKAYFNLKNILSSILYETCNIIDVAENALTGQIAKDTGHAIVLEIKFAEYTGTVGTYTNIYPVFVYKAAIAATAGFAFPNGYGYGYTYRTAFAGEYIYPTCYKLATGDVVVYGVEGGNITEAVSNNIFAQFRITANHSTANRISLSSSHGGKRLIVEIDRNNYPRKLTLHFLNRYGGWDWYDVVDYEKTVKVNKSQLTRYVDMYGSKAIHQHVSGQVTELKCYGRQGAAEYLSYIEDLVTSPMVIDQDGNRVRVLDDNILTDAHGILEPEFTIQYIEENVINY